MTFECKKVEDSIPKSVWETYSSFANAADGTIVLGITENTKVDNVEDRFVLTGIHNLQKLKKDLFNTLNSNKVKSSSEKNLISRLMAYCQEPRSLQEIAAELGFSDRYRIKRVYINSLLGIDLQMTSAGSKTDPTQKYVVIEHS